MRRITLKNGIVRGLQRYSCRQCACSFTDTAPRGKPAAMKALALLLYATGNMSICGIGRLLKVSDVSILRWAQAAALELPDNGQFVPGGFTHHLCDPKNYAALASVFLSTFT